MPTYFSPDGNPEIWAEKPAGYYYADEWRILHPEVPQEPSLEEFKDLKISEINDAFSAHVKGRTPISLGWDMQFNLNDILMVDGSVRALEMMGGTEGYLTDADNINHYGLSIQQIKQAVLEMTVAHMQAHAHKQQLRDLINSATSIESLSGVVWLL